MLRPRSADRTEGVQKRKRRRRIDFTSGLFSDELILHIFSHLSGKDLVHCALVNSRWSRLAKDEQLWKHLFQNHFYTPHTNVKSLELPVSWRRRYRIAHNWHQGRCTMTDIPLTDASPTRAIQCFKNILCIAENDRLAFWQLSDGKSPQRLKCCTSSTPSNITLLKLDQSTTSRQNGKFVAAYADGGFSLWEYCSKDDFNCRELARSVPHDNDTDEIISIGIAYPIIVTCTTRMALSIYHISDNGSRIVHRSQSPAQWDPVCLDVEQISTNNLQWRVMVVFGMAVGQSSMTLGVQEFVVSTTTLLSSRHCATVEQDRLFFMDTLQSQQEAARLLQSINAIAYSKPYIVVANANNTIRQYKLEDTNHRLKLTYTRTLYGHTFGVNTLALSTPISRLVSGDRTGIKIWHLGQLDQQHGVDYLVGLQHHATQSQMKELPPWIVEWLHFDEDKIVALVRDKREMYSVVRIWSFQ